MVNVAIIGAGLAGCVVSEKLSERATVKILEKSKSPGGRMATRVSSQYEFDHGAQFFTARSVEFRKFLAPLLNEGLVACWNARFSEYQSTDIIRETHWSDSRVHYVGTPKMSSLADRLSTGLDCTFDVEVAKAEKKNGRWVLYDSRGENLGDYDWIVLTAPAAQTHNLLPNEVDFKAKVGLIKMSGCYSLMLGYQNAIDLPFDAAVVKGTNISWISVNSSKPKRKGFSILIHSTNSWAAQNMDTDLSEVQDKLCDYTSDILRFNVETADYLETKRWRFANSARQTNQPFFLDKKNKVASCGDWCIKGRIEAAFLSAKKLSDQLLKEL